MADLIKFSVDGKELQAAPGTLLIDACRDKGIEVPSFCYYPGFSLQAACRMCLVEVEKTPKLQTACTTPVGEGMIVRTTSPVVVDARKSMLELLLANHPLDCPVCDKGGECELQDMVFRYGAAESRFREEKRHVPEQQWSPIVFYDAPRCILCYRCVRVCNEGMGVGALGIINRGAKAEIAPNHGDRLECEECGMCIDICPVGALTSGAYRYKARPWEINYVATICSHCGDGCKTTLSVRNGQVLRGNNRDHSGINGEFLCIKGRYGYDYIEHPERVKSPLIRKDGKLVPATWEEAIRTVANKWKEIVAKNSGGKPGFGVIGSNHTSNEENYLLQKFARSMLKTNHIDHHRTADYPAFVGALASLAASPAERASAVAAASARSKDLANASAVLLVGSNLTEQHPLLAWNIREGVRLRGTKLYVVNSRAIKLLKQAKQFLPVAPGSESAAVAYLAGDGGAEQKLVGKTAGGRDVTSQSLNDFKSALLAEKDVVVVFGSEITGDAIRQLIQFGSQLQGRTRYIALGEYSNSRGAADMGLLPDLLPGYASIDDASVRQLFESCWGATIPAEGGMTVSEMLSAVAGGSLDALYVVGANPLKGQDPGKHAGKSFVVVQDMFLHETAQAADVVLPAASAYEKNGTVTNTCGELQRLRKAMEVTGTRPDLEIVQRLAAAMDPQYKPVPIEEVLEESRKMVPGYEVSLVNILSGGSEPVVPVNGHAPALPSRLVQISPSSETLFTSGTQGRYSASLQSVPEKLSGSQPALA